MERPVAEKRGPGVTIGGHLRVRSRRRLIPNGSRKGSRAVRARLRVFAPVAATVTKSGEAGAPKAKIAPPGRVKRGPLPKPLFDGKGGAAPPPPPATPPCVRVR